MTNDLWKLAEVQAGAWGLAFDREQWASYEAYALLLASYDEANVIGTRDFGGIVLDHVMDSLSCLLFEPVREDRRLVDVGSGGGLPGVPLSIANPRLTAVLVESTGKKARFLRHAIESLSLQTEVVNMRAEGFARGVRKRGTFDLATSRAVARLSVILEYCVPMLHVGGYAVSMKARVGEEELEEGKKAAGELGARLLEVIRVPILPEIGNKERHLVVFEKVRETPRRYPRGVGVPTKRPLGAV